MLSWNQFCCLVALVMTLSQVRTFWSHYEWPYYCHLNPCSHLVTKYMDRKLSVHLGEGVGPPSNNVARAEAYLHAKFHLDPSNRLATVHQRHSQDKTDRQRSDSIGRTFYKRSPKNHKNVLTRCSCKPETERPGRSKCAGSATRCDPEHFKPWSLDWHPDQLCPWTPLGAQPHTHGIFFQCLICPANLGWLDKTFHL